MRSLAVIAKTRFFFFGRGILKTAALPPTCPPGFPRLRFLCCSGSPGCLGCSGWTRDYLTALGGTMLFAAAPVQSGAGSGAVRRRSCCSVCNGEKPSSPLPGTIGFHGPTSHVSFCLRLSSFHGVVFFLIYFFRLLHLLNDCDLIFFLFRCKYCLVRDSRPQSRKTKYCCW